MKPPSRSWRADLVCRASGLRAQSPFARHRAPKMMTYVRSTIATHRTTIVRRGRVLDQLPIANDCHIYYSYTFANRSRAHSHRSSSNQLRADRRNIGRRSINLISSERTQNEYKLRQRYNKLYNVDVVNSKMPIISGAMNSCLRHSHRFRRTPQLK